MTSPPPAVLGLNTSLLSYLSITILTIITGEVTLRSNSIIYNLFIRDVNLFCLVLLGQCQDFQKYTWANYPKSPSQTCDH